MTDAARKDGCIAERYRGQKPSPPFFHPVRSESYLAPFGSQIFVSFRVHKEILSNRFRSGDASFSNNGGGS